MKMINIYVTYQIKSDPFYFTAFPLTSKPKSNFRVTTLNYNLLYLKHVAILITLMDLGVYAHLISQFFKVATWLQSQEVGLLQAAFG